MWYVSLMSENGERVDGVAVVDATSWCQWCHSLVSTCDISSGSLCRWCTSWLEGIQRSCTKCGVEKTGLDFSVESRFKDGLHTQCRDCRRVYQRARSERISVVGRLVVVLQDDSQKECSRCGVVKLAMSDFSADKTRLDGRDPVCKSCRKAWAASRPVRTSVRVDKAVVSDGTKCCRACGQDLELHRFWRNKNSPDGRSYTCFDCSSNASLERRKLAAASNLERGVKACGRCGLDLPLAKFFLSKRSLDGYSVSCQSCHGGNAKLDPVEAAEDARFLARRAERWKRLEEQLPLVREKMDDQRASDELARRLWGDPLDLSGDRDYRPGRIGPNNNSGGMTCHCMRTGARARLVAMSSTR